MKHLLWVDTETSGLKPGPGQALLEIALVVTDMQFEVQASTSTLVPADTRAAYEIAEPFVRDIHTANDLWLEHHNFMQAAPPTIEALSDALLTWAAGFGFFPGDKSTLFCAQGAVGVDHEFLTAYLPRVRAIWGHRALDLSAWHSLAEAWYDFKYADVPTPDAPKHRALGDALRMVETAKYFQRNFWK